MSMVISTAGIRILVLAVLTIFVILCVAISTALKQASIFGGRTAVMVAVRTTLLCVIGLYRTFLPADVGKDTSGSSRLIGVDFVLLPYTALGIAVRLVLLLLVLFDRLTRRDKLHQAAKDIIRQTESPRGFRDRRAR